MARTRFITTVKECPPYAQEGARRIEQFGFSFKYVNEWMFADLNRRVQVRDTDRLAPPKEVSKYKTALQRGDQFPPVILTNDGWLVDGATRTEAARSLGWEGFHTFILDINYADATEAQRRQLVYLGAGFNLTHGKGMSMMNVASIIEAITEDDESPKDVARKLHIPESTAATVMNAKKARDRAENLGVRLNGNLTNSHLKLFGGKSRLYSDEVFREFIQLAQDAKLTNPVTNDLAKRIEVLGSESDRLRLLDSERAAHREIIKGGATRPTRAAKLRQSLGYLLNQENPELLVETEPDASDEHLRMLQLAADKLAKVAAGQLHAEEARLKPVRSRRVKAPFGG